MSKSLLECEREVEVAREKLRKDLSTLQSPITFSSFANELKSEALETKHVVVERAKETVRTTVEDFLEDVKARAAANPAAALAIGAGVAWQLIRHPPVTTLLVGAGALSLWRTTPRSTQRDTDYVEEGKQRLKEQVSEFAADVAGVATDTARALAEKAAQASETAMSAGREWSRDATRTAADLTSQATQAAQGAVTAARSTMSDAAEQTMSIARESAANARTLTRGAVYRARDKISADAGTQDKLLLGIAGLAVAGALGIAWQKRTATDAQVSPTP